MDINSLLSPSETPASGASTPSENHPRKDVRRDTSSSLRRSTASSPALQDSTQALQSPYFAVSQVQQVPTSGPIISPIRDLLSHDVNTSPAVDNHIGRQPSTPGMDTLAELASMQQNQSSARVNTGGLKNPDSYETQLSTATLHPSPNPLPYKSSDLPVLDEDLWVQQIEDGRRAAKTTEDRLSLMEECGRVADEEEVGSVKLWSAYGELMLYLYDAAHGADDTWSEEDKIIGIEIFNSQSVIDVWKNGAMATRYRINDSNLVWDRYIDLVLKDLEKGAPKKKVDEVKSEFLSRLQIPHATWGQTFQLFSTFISTYDNQLYEEIMVSTNELAASAKSKYSLREPMELKLQQAVEAEDKAAERAAFSEYLEWEQNQNRKRNKAYSSHLCNALFERALLRFPKDTDLWLDYLDFITRISREHDCPVSGLEVLERSTRHCPGSGDLWEQYLLFLENEQRPHSMIEEIKHKATSSGKLEQGPSGMDEVIKVHAAWCNYLRRRAFRHDGEDEDIDVAEMGIRSSMEDVQSLGEKKYQMEKYGTFPGDPRYRLEQIYVKFLSQRGSWDSARQVWKDLIPKWGDNYEFWLGFYGWEMVTWGKAVTLGQQRNEINVAVARRQPWPSDATGVLKQAIKRPNLDWPEKVLEMCRMHVENHEDVDEVQLALAQIRQAEKAVRRRREKETIEAAIAAQGYQEATSVDQIASATQHMANGKRKRNSDLDMVDEGAHKKSRPDQAEDQDVRMEDQSLSAPSIVKRDRENATVFVKNLSVGTDPAKVRRFFRDCGIINSLNLNTEPDGLSATAIIEFDSKEDVLAAKTRDLKVFDGNELEVQIGTGSTLWVTNFPPTADEAYIRRLFEPYGEVVDVRFPSLKYNTHRRFCYVQFQSSSQAKAAAELDGHAVTEKLKLVARVSDPSRKQERSGAVYEGREIYISNVDWSATEDELKQIFSKYGSVERIRIPTKLDGKSKGFAFVTFSTKTEATAALDMNMTKFKSRILNVEISEAKGAKRQATTIINSAGRSTASPTPDTLVNEDDASSPGATSTASLSNRPTTDEIRARTMALINIPDTINDTRIRALAEPFGNLVKVTLKPDHQGAIIEFSDTGAVGRASLSLNGHEIAPGRKIQVGTVSEMLKQRAEMKTDRLVVGVGRSGHNNSGNHSTAKSSTPSSLQSAMPIRRPGQPSAGRGRRGGLGLKRGPPRGSGLSHSNDVHEKMDISNGRIQNTQTGSEKLKPKSNEDFKAMFLNK
ncbi:MAG: Splicing factor [Cirrosporium novae-zelandiae]|nr:MAG: Splicing factor [Cirrosporium novae-zelandiae]